MPSQGSTTKKCVVCHTQLYVASKICKTCKAEQPRQLRLRKRMERFEKKRESWVQNNRKNRTSSRVLDEAYILLEKLHALGIKAVLLLSRPGRKQCAWKSEVLAPRCQLTATSSTCLQKMKDLYDVVIQVGPQVALTGPPAAPTGTPAALMGPSAYHATPACPVCLKKAATSPPDIKPETEDIGSTNSHTADHSSSPVLSVTVTHTGFDGEIQDTGHCGEKEDDRKRRKMSGSEASGQPFTSGHISDATSAASQGGIKEESIEAMCGGTPAMSESVLVECKYENTDATTSGHEAAELQGMELETRVPQTSRASDHTQSSDMMEAPSSRPSTSCDLDTMDLDQLRREKIKMQIKVLRLQEEYYTQKIKEHKS